ncbi:hypothetical protein GUJ93_ZPchr0010g11228 [Zizania palustris]|uniref:Uncharacterized protein n=1 Tax=Zizania palustris TaxID=103762 RepID=A0A8J6BG01_ZIZPA|nr:hypothetical protein GUJ93_ZPchr0010g11228 [Zizania palustris]
MQMISFGRSHLDACLPASLFPHHSFALLWSFPFFTASLRSNAHPLYKGELHTASSSSSSVSLSPNPKSPSFSFVVDPAISRPKTAGYFPTPSLVFVRCLPCCGEFQRCSSAVYCP